MMVKIQEYEGHTIYIETNITKYKCDFIGDKVFDSIDDCKAAIDKKLKAERSFEPIPVVFEKSNWNKKQYVSGKITSLFYNREGKADYARVSIDGGSWEKKGLYELFPLELIDELNKLLSDEENAVIAHHDFRRKNNIKIEGK